MPIIEETGLFERLVGKATDIVEKEMYTFQDRNGEYYSQTRGYCGVRKIYEQNGLLFNQIRGSGIKDRCFAMKGHRGDATGNSNNLERNVSEFPSDIDAEIILLNARIFRLLGLDGDITLELNSLGNSESKKVSNMIWWSI